MNNTRFKTVLWWKNDHKNGFITIKILRNNHPFHGVFITALTIWTTPEN